MRAAKEQRNNRRVAGFSMPSGEGPGSWQDNSSGRWRVWPLVTGDHEVCCLALLAPLATVGRWAGDESSSQ